MPYKYSIKQYVEGGFYHIYNRGINKNKIFLDKKDYQVFLNCLKFYLLPKEEIVKIIDNFNLPYEIKLKKKILVNFMDNFYQRINLHVFVLMPNHFHFLVQQKEKWGIKFFLKSLLTKYVIYFNKKYNRIGPLFQGRYRAVFVSNERYLIHLSRYIHLNPKDILVKDKKLIEYPWSSYPFYLKNYQSSWLKKDLILSYFLKVNGFGFSSYQGFVEGYRDTEKDQEFKKLYLLD